MSSEISIFHDSLLYKQHIKKCLYIIYTLQKNISNHWITRLPPPLLKEILLNFLVDPFTIGRYYSVIDNFNNKNSFDKIDWGGNESEKKRWKDRGIYYIGKIIDKKFKNNNILYLISYKDWPDNFNEWVTKKQIFHMKNNYIYTLKKNQLIDCYCNDDKIWYGGIITKLYYSYDSRKNKYLTHIDIISSRKIKKQFFCYIKLPIYSNNYAKFRTHIRIYKYNINKIHLLSALQLLDKNKLKKNTKYLELPFSAALQYK